MPIVSLRAGAAVLASAALLLTGCERPGTGKPSPSAATALPASVAPPTPSTSSTSVTPPPDNGVSALDPREALQGTIAALKSTKSYLYDGCHFNADPNLCAKISIVGNDFTGMMTVAEGKADVRYVGGRSFLRGNRAFWGVLFPGDTAFDRAAATKAAALNAGGWWIEMPSDYNILGDHFAPASVWAELQSAETAYRIGPLQLEGRPPGLVIGLGGNGRVIVATTGKPYPIRISTEKTTADLSQFGTTAAAVKAPTSGDIVPLTDLFKRRDTARA
jgi:hypothetical protein